MRTYLILGLFLLGSFAQAHAAGALAKPCAIKCGETNAVIQYSANAKGDLKKTISRDYVCYVTHFELKDGEMRESPFLAFQSLNHRKTNAQIADEALDAYITQVAAKYCEADDRIIGSEAFSQYLARKKSGL